MTQPAPAAPTALMVLAPGFEELEAVAPADILRRGGFQLTLASLEGERLVAGRNEMRLQADATLDAALGRPYDLVVLPGGPGVARLRADARVQQLVQAQAAAGRWLAAICAAPTVLHDAGLLAGRRYACHFSVKDELPHGLALPVVEDGKLLTSPGAGTAAAFGLAIVARIVSPEKARAVAAAMVCLPEA